MRYRRKPEIVEAVTFKEFVEYGKEHTSHLVDGMPCHFEYQRHPVTQENNLRYIIVVPTGCMDFTPSEMLVTFPDGNLYLCDIDIFNKIHEAVAEDD